MREIIKNEYVGDWIVKSYSLYACEKCGKRYIRKKNVQRHEKGSTANKEKGDEQAIL